MKTKAVIFVGLSLMGCGEGSAVEDLPNRGEVGFELEKFFEGCVSQWWFCPRIPLRGGGVVIGAHGSRDLGDADPIHHVRFEGGD